MSWWSTMEYSGACCLSFQFNFGVSPPPLDTDKALKEPCLDICTNARRRKELGTGSSTDGLQCPQVWWDAFESLDSITEDGNEILCSTATDMWATLTKGPDVSDFYCRRILQSWISEDAWAYSHCAPSSVTATRLNCYSLIINTNTVVSNNSLYFWDVTQFYLEINLERCSCEWFVCIARLCQFLFVWILIGNY